MGREKVFFNAKLVLPEECVKGTLVIEGGKIKSVADEKTACRSGIDCKGDYLLPGLIEIHTDNLEKHAVPRPGIFWPSLTASIIAHDNQILGSGITTVLDAIAIGFDDSSEYRFRILDKSIQGISHAGKYGILRADHFLHLRCELPSSTVADLFDRYVNDPLVALVSVMDHTPGQRQWRDLLKWRIFNRDKNWSDADARAVIEQRRSLQKRYADKNRRRILAGALERNLPVASHDDTTKRDCVEACKSGVGISEFPTTYEAALKAKELGMRVVMGAPNMVRGESHSGNISAQLLAERGLLDGFSSDYMPVSLLHAAFELYKRLHVPLYRAVSTVTSTIASMVKLDDRGVLEPGKKADIIRVRVIDCLPIVRGVWKNGNQVYCSQQD
ncbi:MAG: alpha-D-ribose 1-methylphosphonate 5-triphosphate diphosphatase [Spirochaetales bacterium]|nr:alpha-D-ribose 1-methylphosphonate 5-triphosphate diphosphatase [Spirochaetales bacterium]